MELENDSQESKSDISIKDKQNNENIYKILKNNRSIVTMQETSAITKTTVSNNVKILDPEEVVKVQIVEVTNVNVFIMDDDTFN